METSIRCGGDSKALKIHAKEKLFIDSNTRLQMKRQPGSNFAIVFCILATILFISVRVHMAKKARYSRPGSVADLVRRGQLRSDRRGISTPLKYEDPFNNPLVKVGKSNSTVEMCGKVYRLAPVTLTREQQAIHQKRRSRAYQWKRPTVFLREGDPVPPDVDPDTIRWIPANHPFATTASDIDEDLAQNNVYQKHGVPFRIQAEHEALQRKLEALQSQQQFKKLVIDPGAAKDFERPFRSHPKDGKIEDNQSYNPLAPKPSKLEHGPNSFGSNSTSEESPEI
ncbi:protein MULTIPLE CHLOROPLAST DIVISION SITE 1-like isoform X4 [Rhododendron vialii]|uniref:protein MULTIPLE CHLOROPLAST DIVISION SITE 1-like isoform X4 n=1 Tax=Rhododendron vialii TaxID=182163 RepID=UPI00265F3E7B|nr:protein MULTIPLE CHLOROPLAST DIVISION SITE 1-like isoform X4 [Rhododendron vialii]